ncbi:MAG TPA: type II toxin-antitoxin system VapC family toxin [Terriglobales bacterium]
MTRAYVLDANAAFDFLEGGLGAPRVKQLLMEALRQEVSVAMSVLNLGEVFYLMWEQRGDEVARNAIAELSRAPIQFIPIDLSLSLKAAEIKAVHKIPYVDCVAAALAILTEAVLVTGDRDFEKLGRHASILWIKVK